MVVVTITVGAVLVVGVVIAATIIPAFLATAVIGYLAYCKSPLTKIKQYFSRPEASAVCHDRHELIADLENNENMSTIDIAAHADQVMALMNHKKRSTVSLSQKLGHTSMPWAY